MALTQTLFAVLTIILFCIGAWPIAFITLVIWISIKVARTFKQKQEKKLEQQVRELKEENEKLRQAADQKFVQDIIDKTSGK